MENFLTAKTPFINTDNIDLSNCIIGPNKNMTYDTAKKIKDAGFSLMSYYRRAPMELADYVIMTSDELKDYKNSEDIKGKQILVDASYIPIEDLEDDIYEDVGLYGIMNESKYRLGKFPHRLIFNGFPDLKSYKEAKSVNIIYKGELSLFGISHQIDYENDLINIAHNLAKGIKVVLGYFPFLENCIDSFKIYHDTPNKKMSKIIFSAGNYEEYSYDKYTDTWSAYYTEDHIKKLSENYKLEKMPSCYYEKHNLGKLYYEHNDTSEIKYNIERLSSILKEYLIKIIKYRGYYK